MHRTRFDATARPALHHGALHHGALLTLATLISSFLVIGPAHSGAAAAVTTGSKSVAAQATAHHDTLTPGVLRPPSTPGLSLAGAEFGTVACTSTSACVALGTFFDVNGDNQPFAANLSGGIWAPVQLPVPSGANANPEPRLKALVCPAAGVCVSVGDYFDSSSNEQGLIETLSSGTWTAAEAPLPTGGTYSVEGLTALACPASGTCFAVGDYENPGAFTEDGLIET